MSLKAFHVFFISISIALSIGFGFWALERYVVLSALSLAAGVSLVVYLFWFLKKLKNLKKS